AEAAAARDRLERDRAALKTTSEQLAADRDVLAVREGKLADQWAAAWPGLPDSPRTPEEMREWLADRSAILATVRAAREDDAAAPPLQRAVQQQRAGP